MKRWTKNYDCCRWCKRTDFPYAADGLCRVCMAITEESIQAEIIDAFKKMAYIVRQTTVRGFQGRVKNGRRVGYGATKGVPDLLITRAGWNVTIELEVKAPKTPESPEQFALNRLGVLWFVRSLDDAIAAVKSIEVMYGLKGACSQIGAIR